MALLSSADVHRMFVSTTPITPSNALHDGWSVQLFCTGTGSLSERRLCVVGSSLGGLWFLPPVYFTDSMVIIVLVPKKDPLHYSIVDEPYERGVASTWFAEWNTEVVDMYKCVVSDLWSLGVSNASPVSFGVSAGVLSTMVLLTSMLEDTSVHFSSPIGVFIAGAWHPKAHYRFGKAVLSSDC